jgi:hypothetical protein
MTLQSSGVTDGHLYRPFACGTNGQDRPVQPADSDPERLAAVRSVLESVTEWRAPTELINFVGRANDPDAVLRSRSPDQNDRLDTIRSQHDPVGILTFGRHRT